MAQVILSPEAAQDIQETWAFIAEDNLDAADRWLGQIEEAFQLLCQMPHLGRKRTEFSRPLNSFVKANHLIFYQPANEGIVVFRVLHHARDVEAIVEQQIQKSGGDLPP